MTLLYKKIVLVGGLSVALLVGLLGGGLSANPQEELYVILENAAKHEETLFNDIKKRKNWKQKSGSSILKLYKEEKKIMKG
ncbi:hypothetical protein bthur0004_66230 [Bacillus thuringiensis serovar sotto str. T04001]|nr:hypothetical protein bthur0004_66230 [Bacillus thuringiensis serovar sotto str. T04001]